MAALLSGLLCIYMLFLDSFHQTEAATAGESWICSQSEEKCVFPFKYNGVTYTDTCVDGTLGDWCKTDGSYGWAYCGLCESTSVEKPASSMTAQPSTSPATTTSTTANPTASPAATTAPTSPTTTYTAVRVAPQPVDVSSTTVTGALSSDAETTGVVKEEKNDEDSGTTTTEAPGDPENPVVDEMQSPSTATTDTPRKPDKPDTSASTTTVASTTISTEAVGSTRTKAMATTSSRKTSPAVKPEPNPVEPGNDICTLAGRACGFPFTYGGETYSECVPSFLKNWGWCYIDAELGEYSDCIPCHLTTTVPVTTTQFMSFLNKFSSDLTTTSKSSGITTTTVDTGDADMQEPSDGDDGIGTVTIILLILGVVFVIVLIAVIYLYLAKLRRSKNAENDEDKKPGDASSEGLLQHNKNGNHKSMNDSDQEMQPLNGKRTEAGDGDHATCDVITEDNKMTGDRNTVTV